MGEKGACSPEVGGKVSPGFSQGPIAAVLFSQPTCHQGAQTESGETLSKMGLPQVQREGG